MADDRKVVRADLRPVRKKNGILKEPGRILFVLRETSTYRPIFLSKRTSIYCRSVAT